VSTLRRLALSPTLPRRLAWHTTELVVLVGAVGGILLGHALL
jgi:hypothetical protein